MNDLPRRQSREVITGLGDEKSRTVASQLGQRILMELDALPDKPATTESPWVQALKCGGADGLNGADGSGNDPEMIQDYLDRISREEK